MKAELPSDEGARLASLVALEVLDTPPEPGFEDVTFLASHVCSTPISLVTLVDEKRQWFKSERGLGLRETPREISFCAHAILSPDTVLVVPDAEKDPRFADNDLVIGPPHLRFYAGVPLVVGAHGAVGTLSVLDVVPRQLDEPQIECLRRLARQVVARLELGNRTHELRDLALRLARAEARLSDERDELRQTASELLATNEQLEAFDYMVSHDLRAPLRHLAQLSAILLEEHGVQLAPEARGLVERVESESQGLLRMVDAILRLARITQTPIVRERVDLVPIAREVSARLASAESERDVDLALPESLVVSADPQLARVLLTNLLQNAWKYTRRRPHTRIELGAEETHEGVVVTVRDNGIGFEKERAQEIFQPFRRLSGASAQEGTGIGLATVHRIVARHGGRVWAEGRPGEGATIRFTLAPPPAPAQAR